MNETERLILENQQVIMNAVNFIMINNTSNSGDIQGYIIEANEKTEKALAPQSMKQGYEGDIAETKLKPFDNSNDIGHSQNSETKSEKTICCVCGKDTKKEGLGFCIDLEKCEECMNSEDYKKIGESVTALAETKSEGSK